MCCCYRTPFFDGKKNLLFFAGDKLRVIRRVAIFAEEEINFTAIGTQEKMLESRPEDALVKLVKLVKL